MICTVSNVSSPKHMLLGSAQSKSDKTACSLPYAVSRSFTSLLDAAVIKWRAPIAQHATLKSVISTEPISGRFLVV